MAKEMIRQFFTPQIMKMGEALVKKGAVSLTKQTDGRFEAEVKDGRKSYSVKVSGNFSDGSIEFDCECEYFTSSGHNCKHLAALACCVGDEKLFGDPSSEEPFFNVEGLFSELFDFDYRELNKVKEEVIRQKLGVTYHVTNENGNPDDWEVEFCVDTKGKFFGNQRCKCRLRRNIVVSLTCEGSIDKECAMSELAHGKFYLDPAKRHKPCIHKMALYVVLTSVLAEYDINPYTNLKAGRMLRELEEADEKETDREALQVDMLPVLSLRDFSITVRVFRNGKSLICPDIGPMLDFFDSGDEYGVRDDMKIDFSSDYLSDGALKVIRFCSSVVKAEKRMRFMMRKLPLENHMDYFCCMFAGTKILKQGGGALKIIDGPPELKFESEIMADVGIERGIRISAMIPPVMREGSTLFFFTDDSIHRCSLRDMYPLNLIGLTDPPAKEWIRELYDFSYEDAAEFRDLALPALRRLGKLDGSAVEKMLEMAE